MITDEGRSINSKQGQMIKETMAAINEDAMQVGQRISNALMENPKLLESLLE